MPIISWYDDPKDRQLYDLIPTFILLSRVYDMRDAITRFVKNTFVDFNLAKRVCTILIEQQEKAKEKHLEMLALRQQQAIKAQEDAEKRGEAKSNPY